MIKTNELRVGNWVLHHQSPLQIESIWRTGINATPSQSYGMCEIEPDAEFEVIEPIRLTPEILDKCGFEQRPIDTEVCYCLPYKRPLSKEAKHDLVLLDYAFASEEHKGEYAAAIREHDRDIQFAITMVKYLHQLQNLYFSLTGTDLNYNP